MQILGIGTDGHIGFNEPGSSFASLTRVKTLTEQTRRDNARFFDSIDEVPMHCITQGLGTILRARHLLLLAFGEGKAEALAGAVEGPVTASIPGSAIQLHPHVTVRGRRGGRVAAEEHRLLPVRLCEQAGVAGALGVCPAGPRSASVGGVGNGGEMGRNGPDCR